MRQKLAIVGSGLETRELAPWDDESFDIWVFNEAASNSPWCKRYDAVFQMHAERAYTGPNAKDPHYWEWLQQPHNTTIYMQTADPRVPDAVQYPLEEVCALVGGLRYLTGTPAYALALAALKGYPQVDIYGVEMSFSEYEYQASAWRFWVGFLFGRGVKVNLYSGQKHFKALLYGYEGNLTFDPAYFEARRAELEKLWNVAESNAKAQRRCMERTIQLDKYTQFPDEFKKFYTVMQESGQAAGALSEAERYLNLGKPFEDRGAFEFNAASAQREGEAERIKFYQILGKVEYVWGLWKQITEPAARARVMNNLLQLSMLAGQQAYEWGGLSGIYQENVNYVLRYDDIAQANGIIRQEK